MISNWKKTGKLSIVGKLGILFVVGLILSIPQAFNTNFSSLESIVNNFDKKMQIVLLIVSMILSIISLLINMFIYPAFYLSKEYVYLKVVREEKFAIKDSFYGFSNYKKAVKLYLMMILYIFLGLILFIVPGIILAYKYSMCFYILADDPDISVKECLKKSSEITSGYKSDLFLMDLSFIGWDILAVLTLGILCIWLTPYQNASKTAAYLYLNPNKLINEKTT